MVDTREGDSMAQIAPPVTHVPLVSIGLPVYNGEKYVREAIDSLLAQSLTDFELLISDNASTDDTRRICEAYARRDSRVRYLRQPENIGAGRNFEFVLDNARGKFFMWAAHDDAWAANWLEVLVSAIRVDDFCVRGALRFVREGQLVVERLSPDYRAGQHLRFFLAEETTMNARNFYIYGLFHRLKLRALDRAVLCHHYYPDFLYTFQMLEQGSLRCVAGTYQCYRLHGDNTGPQMMKAQLGWARWVYRVHPASYYRSYLAIAPADKRWKMRALIPVKHLFNQMHLWFRGFRRVILRAENI
jgi:glycosyltransferase involved in cell wall biosynthesis